MSNILYISSSVRGAQSQSKQLGDFFLTQLKKQDLDAKVKHRDVGTSPPRHPTHDYTVANYTTPNDRTVAMQNTLAESDSLVDEVLEADKLIYAVPMYNFSVPSTFKAYIDNIVRVNRTFEVVEGGGFAGVLGAKKAIFITARGAMYGENSPIKDLDLQTPYLKTVFGFMGLTDITFAHADGLDFGSDEYHQQSLESARAELIKIARHW